MLEWIWLAVILVALLIEWASFSLLSIWFAAAGVLALILAYLNVPVVVQIVVFFVVAIILLVFTRPYANRYFKTNKINTNIDRIIGMTGTVTKDVSKNVRGEVNVDGKYWTAITLLEEEYKSGEIVEIKSIDGVKLIIGKISN